LSTPFSDQQFAEAGASRIPSNHNLTLAYADYFGLTLDAFYPTNGEYVELSGQTQSTINAAQYINQPPWPGSVNRSAYTKIRGGMHNLPLAFTQALEDKITFSSVVSAIEQTTDKVVVTRFDGQEHIVDRVLCTVPLTVLEEIQFTPALSIQKTEAANGGYHYAASSRLFTQFSNRFWQNQNLNGWGNTSLPEEIWQPTWDNEQPSGIVMSYLRHGPAVEFDKLSAAEQITSVHNRWNNAFTGFSDSILNTHVHAWSQEPWSRAAFAAPTSSQNSELASYIGQAEGRVHFAGEHASNFHGWIQGALESGIRAANEIHNS
jgi:monoamine oxidase